MPLTPHELQVQTWKSGTVERTRLSGIGGLLVFSGAIVYVAHVIWRSVLTAGLGPTDSAQAGLWVPVNALGALGALLVLVGWPAVSTRTVASRTPWSLIGFALIEVSWAFFGVFLSLHGALIQPWMAKEAPELITGSSSTSLGIVVAFAVGIAAWFLGATLVTIPMVREATGERWVGYLLLASAMWFLVGSFVIAPDGPASNLLANLLSNLGPVLLLIALGWLGLRSWMDQRTDAHVASNATSFRGHYS